MATPSSARAARRVHRPGQGRRLPSPRQPRSRQRPFADTEATRRAPPPPCKRRDSHEPRRAPILRCYTHTRTTELDLADPLHRTKATPHWRITACGVPHEAARLLKPRAAQRSERRIPDPCAQSATQRKPSDRPPLPSMRSGSCTSLMGALVAVAVSAGGCRTRPRGQTEWRTPYSAWQLGGIPRSTPFTQCSQADAQTASTLPCTCPCPGRRERKRAHTAQTTWCSLRRARLCVGRNFVDDISAIGAALRERSENFVDDPSADVDTPVARAPRDSLAASSSVDRAWLPAALTATGAPQELLRIVEAIYHDTVGLDAMARGLIHIFCQGWGMARGCPASGWLFTVAVDLVLRFVAALFGQLGTLCACAVDLVAALLNRESDGPRVSEWLRARAPGFEVARAQGAIHTVVGFEVCPELLAVAWTGGHCEAAAACRRDFLGRHDPQPCALLVPHAISIIGVVTQMEPPAGEMRAQAKRLTASTFGRHPGRSGGQGFSTWPKLGARGSVVPRPRRGGPNCLGGVPRRSRITGRSLRLARLDAR